MLSIPFCTLLAIPSKRTIIKPIIKLLTWSIYYPATLIPACQTVRPLVACCVPTQLRRHHHFFVASRFNTTNRPKTTPLFHFAGGGGWSSVHLFLPLCYPQICVSINCPSRRMSQDAVLITIRQGFWYVDWSITRGSKKKETPHYKTAKRCRHRQT